MNAKWSRVVHLILLIGAVRVVPAQAQWNAVAGLEYAVITCFLATDDTTFYVGGHMGLLRRSTNRGETWQDIWGNGIQSDTILALGTSGDYLFAGTNGLHSVSRSSNRGDTWEVANSGLPGNLVVYQFEEAGDTLFLCSAIGVYASTDNGGNWNGVDLLGMGDSQFAAHTRGLTTANEKLYCATENSGVFVTSLSGYAWQSIGSPSAGAIAIASVDTSVFVATWTKVHMYSGNGTNWVERSNGLPEYLYWAILKPAGDALLLYTGDAVYVTRDLGLNWREIPLDDLTSTLVSSMVVTSEEVIVGTDQGAWRLPMGTLLTSVETVDDAALLPRTHELSQNYPNPFNAETRFEFRVAEVGFVRVTVVDILGRTVAELVNAELSPGRYTLRWDASDVPSGTYLVRSRANGSERLVKVVLQK